LNSSKATELTDIDGDTEGTFLNYYDERNNNTNATYVGQNLPFGRLCYTALKNHSRLAAHLPAAVVMPSSKVMRTGRFTETAGQTWER
jgi:hypothetical protein